VTLAWDVADGTFTIEKHHGQFPELVGRRPVTVTLVNEDRSVGHEPVVDRRR